MAASLNKVLLMGNLTRDPEVKYTPKGTAVCDLGLAINDSYKAQDGTIKEVTTFVDVEVWGRTAENCKQYLSKGRPIFVEGQLKLDTWETPQGEKKSKMRVRADRVQFLGGGGQGGGSGGQGGGNRSGGNYSGGGEQRSNTNTGRTAAPSSNVSEDAPPPRDEDDIPF
jgi:single-strand DNA-binding protein